MDGCGECHFHANYVQPLVKLQWFKINNTRLLCRELNSDLKTQVLRHKGPESYERLSEVITLRSGSVIVQMSVERKLKMELISVLFELQTGYNQTWTYEILKEIIWRFWSEFLWKDYEVCLTCYCYEGPPVGGKVCLTGMMG